MKFQNLLVASALTITVVKCVNQYVVTSDVQAAHGIPPVASLTLTETYLVGVIIFPIILLIIGLLSLFGYAMAMCCRCCFSWCCPGTCRCCYNQEDSFEPSLEKRMFFHRRAIIIFWVFLTSAFIINLMVFIGDANLTTSINNFASAMVSAATIFTIIHTIAGDITNNMQYINSNTSSYPCSQAFTTNNAGTDITGFAQDAISGINEVNNILGDIPSMITADRTILLDQGLYYKNLVVYLYFGIIAFFIVQFVVAYFLRYKFVLTWASFCAWIIVLALTLIACFEMIIVHVLGDFCINPSGTIQNIINDGNIDSIIQYYTVCPENGAGPFQNGYQTALSATQNLNATFVANFDSALHYLNENGYSTQCLYDIQGQITFGFKSLTNLVAEFFCPPIYNVWDQSVQQSLCTSGFSGLFGIWMVHILTSGFLFLTLIASSYFYEMFYPTLPFGHEGKDSEMQDIYPADSEFVEGDPIPHTEVLYENNNRSPHYSNKMADGVDPEDPSGNKHYSSGGGNIYSSGMAHLSQKSHYSQYSVPGPPKPMYDDNKDEEGFY